MSNSNATLDATAHMSSPGGPLSGDILGVIFAINAQLWHSQQRKPWAELESYSLVCKGWRKLIFESPTLWAKGVDTDFLLRMERDVACKYMPRVGEALLWVRGDEECHEEVLFYVLNQWWHNIESLIIPVSFPSFVRQDNKILEIFTRPAPHLRVLRIFDKYGMWRDGGEQGLRPFPLFNDKAPKLRVFHAPFVIQNSLSENLNDVRFWDVQFVSAALAPLRHMKKLEYLSIRTNSVNSLPGEDLSLNPLEIPTLLGLELQVCINDCVAFMRHITPGKGCALSVTARAGPTPLGESSELRGEMLRYFNIYIKDSVVKAVDVGADDFDFIFGAFIDRRHRTNPEPLASFYFKMIGRWGGELYSQLLSDISEVHGFKVRLDLFRCCLHGPFSCSLGNTLRSMAAGLSCKEFLGNSLGLNAMFDFTPCPPLDHRQLPLPDLEIVSIENEPVYQLQDVPTSSPVLELITEAFQKRKNTGRPLPTLNITFGMRVFNGDTNALEKVEGLKVAYLSHSEMMYYTCGDSSNGESFSDWVGRVRSL